jgi:amino acid transporter
MVDDVLKTFRSHLIGSTLKNSEQSHEKYKVLWGLPVLSSDAISSVAYAVEEILIVLVPVVGMASFTPMLGISGFIIALLFILVFCYRQVIDAYPQGGGAYSVAKHNLGRMPSLIAAAALVIDYILTIAVSAGAGAAAVTSAFPTLLPYAVVITIGAIVLLTLGNLRGIKESSFVFGLPTYCFIGVVLIMIVVGVIKVVFFGGAPAVSASTSITQTTEGLSLFLILRAFSSGCSALTGVEAISNSVNNFKEPRQRHAKVTLLLLAFIVMVIFGGISILTMLFKVVPQDNITVVAQIAIDVFGENNPMFYVIQAFTALILLLAANTAFNGLPQLLSVLSIDGFMPSSFAKRGTRLVFSNGILFASVVAIALTILTGADEHLLIAYYSVGVFLSFTIAQGGMVKHWLSTRDKSNHHKALINGFGALVTGGVCVVLMVTKFEHGAWAVVIAIALIVLVMSRIKGHYLAVASELAIAQKPCQLTSTPTTRTHIILPVSTLDCAFLKAYNYAQTLSGDIEVYHVSTSPAAERRFRKHYQELGLLSPLVFDLTPYRNVNEVLLVHVKRKLAQVAKGETYTVVIPRVVPLKWWHDFLHNKTASTLERALYEQRNLTVIMIPYVVDEKGHNRFSLRGAPLKKVDGEASLKERWQP